METKYSKDHEWLTVEGDIATVGITDFAQQELGDLVFVELPKVGAKVTKGGEAATVESVKAASDVFSPLTGEVVEVNKAIVDDPALVNSDPQGAAWFFKMKIADAAELADLMDEAASRLRMQVDSKPEELDELDRRIIQLRIEQEALRKETDTASRDRLAKLEHELADVEEKSAELTARWKAEKDKLGDAQKLKEQLEAARTELAQAQRRGEYQRAGELAYGRIPELERKLADIEANHEAYAGEGRVTAAAASSPGACRQPYRMPITAGTIHHDHTSMNHAT